MKVLNHNSGILELIIGGMMSGKSSSLLNKIRQHKLLDRNVLVINHVSDVRYKKEGVCSHDNIHIEGIMLETLNDIYNLESYKTSDTIFIEEAQFFTDLYDVVYQMVEKDKKYVVVCGLDGDYERKPFQQVIDLIPLSDIVERKNAFCIKCKDGTLASFSKRLHHSTLRNIVGGIDKYVPVCRYHYHNE
jgi:thymidine kinase